MQAATMKPFLIAKDEKGQVRLTVREIRFNSQGYPWATKTLLKDVFENASAAKAYATEHYGAKPGEFAAK